LTRRRFLRRTTGDYVQELQSIPQQFPEDRKARSEVTLPNASKWQHGRSASHKARTLTRVLWSTAAKAGICTRSHADWDLQTFLRRTAAIRAGCEYRSGSVWAMNVHGYRSSGAALCCGLIHPHRCGHPVPIVVPHALAVAEPCAWAGARRVARCNSFEIQTAWSVCAAVRTVLCKKDAHHLHAAADSGSNESAHLMCERSNYGLSWLRRKSWNCGDARVMDLLLGLMHRWRPSGDHTFPFVRRSGGISVNCQREISDNKTSGESGVALLRVGRYTANWRCRCGCRMLADPRGMYSIRFR
jgi:hypothetical protein